MKYLFSSFFTALFTFFLVSPANAAFTDVSDGYPYEDAILYGQDEGIVEGYEDGSFRPYYEITRAAFVKIISEALFPGQASGSNCFPDVQEEWFARYICFLKSKGIVSGHADGLFRPGDTISISEAAKILVESYGITHSDLQPWYRPYIEALAERKALLGAYQLFSDDVSRGQMMEMVYRLEENILTKGSLEYYHLYNERRTLPPRDEQKHEVKLFNEEEATMALLNEMTEEERQDLTFEYLEHSVPRVLALSDPDAFQNGFDGSLDDETFQSLQSLVERLDEGQSGEPHTFFNTHRASIHVSPTGISSPLAPTWDVQLLDRLYNISGASFTPTAEDRIFSYVLDEENASVDYSLSPVFVTKSPDGSISYLLLEEEASISLTASINYAFDGTHEVLLEYSSEGKVMKILVLPKEVRFADMLLMNYLEFSYHKDGKLDHVNRWGVNLWVKGLSVPKLTYSFTNLD